MRIARALVEVTWKQYDPGEYIRRTSGRSSLPDDGVYQVTECRDPSPELPDDDSRVRLVSVDHPDRWYACYYTTACDSNGWREGPSGPWDEDYPPGEAEWPRVKRSAYLASGHRWPNEQR